MPSNLQVISPDSLITPQVQHRLEERLLQEAVTAKLLKHDYDIYCIIFDARDGDNRYTEWVNYAETRDRMVATSEYRKCLATFDLNVSFKLPTDAGALDNYVEELFRECLG